jgi:hypothetical protein
MSTRRTPGRTRSSTGSLRSPGRLVQQESNNLKAQTQPAPGQTDTWWRRGESNPRPRALQTELLRACPAFRSRPSISDRREASGPARFDLAAERPGRGPLAASSLSYASARSRERGPARRVALLGSQGQLSVGSVLMRQVFNEASRQPRRATPISAARSKPFRPQSLRPGWLSNTYHNRGDAAGQSRRTRSRLAGGVPEARILLREEALWIKTWTT